MITLDEFKTYMKISGTGSDSQLNLAIQNAIGFLDEYLGYSLELDDARIASFDYSSQEFELPHVYINSISKIESGDDEFDDSLVEYTGAKKVFNDRGLVKTKESIGPFVQITYSFGYDNDTAPKGLKNILFDVAAMNFKSMGSTSQADIKSESVDGDQIVFKDVVGSLSENSIALLNKYRQYGFSS